MTTGRDDDALTWDGDDDPTLDIGSSAHPDDQSEGEPHAAPPVEPEDRPEAGHEQSRSPGTPVTGLPEGFTAVGKGSDTVGSGPTAATASAGAAAGAAAEREPLGSGALVALGVIGGVYALYAIGWIIGGLRLQGWRPFLVSDAMYQGSLWLAVLAPVLWFATVFLLTRGARAWVRFAWLAAGIVLLVPWPFVFIGAVGQ